jgi:CCR4-NOT transcription complex subunit 9
VCGSAREALKQCLPEPLRDATFANELKNDQATKKWLATLVSLLETGTAPA